MVFYLFGDNTIRIVWVVLVVIFSFVFCIRYKKKMQVKEEKYIGLLSNIAKAKAKEEVTKENEFMDPKKLIQNIKYLVEKYLDERDDLVELIIQDPAGDCVKYIFSEINKGKKIDYEEKDLDMIREIAFYYL